MKPSEEKYHVSLLFMRMRGDNTRLLDLVTRIKQVAIAYLKDSKGIIPTDADLSDYEQADYYCSEIQRSPEYILYRGAALILKTCNDAIKSGKVDENHIRLIDNSYGDLNKAEEAQEIIYEQGQKTGVKGGKESGRLRRLKADPIKEAWQTEADKIWQKPKNSKLSKSSVAELIAKKIGGNARTIRGSIQKPLP